MAGMNFKIANFPPSDFLQLVMLDSSMAPVNSQTRCQVKPSCATQNTRFIAEDACQGVPIGETRSGMKQEGRSSGLRITFRPFTGEPNSLSSCRSVLESGTSLSGRFPAFVPPARDCLRRLRVHGEYAAAGLPPMGAGARFLRRARFGRRVFAGFRVDRRRR